jgi:hypothetical protein
MDYRLLYPNDYIGAHNLKGKDVTKTIKAVEIEDLRVQGGKVERKPVLFFADAEVKLVLCKTNARTIASLYGNEVERWRGKKITMYPTQTKFGPATVDCIRIRPKGAAGSEAPPPPVDENPFPIDGTEGGEE